MCFVIPTFNIKEEVGRVSLVLHHQSYLASLGKWLSVRLQTKWLWVRFKLRSDFASVSSKEFPDIQATVECRFTLKQVHDMIITHSQGYYEFFFLADVVGLPGTTLKTITTTTYFKLIDL